MNAIQERHASAGESVRAIERREEVEAGAPEDLTPGKLILNSARMEFGFSLVWGFLYGAFFKSRGWEVTLTSRIVMPESVQQQCAHRYVCSTKELRLDGWRETSDGRRLLRLTPETGPLYPVRWATAQALMPEPYVCVIYSFPRREPAMQKGVNRADLMHCLPQAHWRDICGLIRAKGYKVVGIGTLDRSTRAEVEALSDAAYFYDRDQRGLNTFFAGQLDVMAAAKTTIAFGGASFISLVFDVPGVSVDGNFSRAFPPFMSRVLQNRRSKFHWLSNQDRQSKAAGCDMDQDVAKYHGWLRDRLMGLIEEALQ